MWPHLKIQLQASRRVLRLLTSSSSSPWSSCLNMCGEWAHQRGRRQGHDRKHVTWKNFIELSPTETSARPWVYGSASTPQPSTLNNTDRHSKSIHSPNFKGTALRWFSLVACLRVVFTLSPSATDKSFSTEYDAFEAGRASYCRQVNQTLNTVRKPSTYSSTVP